MSPTPDDHDRGPADDRPAEGGGDGAVPLWHRSALGRVAVMWGVVLRRFRVYVEQKGNGR